MTDSRINLKNPIVAGILAYLIPGAGHLYQGRLFKAGLYCFCILGLFFSGMAMADWQAVKPPAMGETRLLEKAKYAGQLGVGLPSMYGLVQRARYSSESNKKPETIEEPIVAPFEGVIAYRDEQQTFEEEVTGVITLQPAKAEYGGRTISGELTVEIDGKEWTFTLAPSVNLDRPIKSSKERGVRAEIVRESDGRYEYAGELVGSIPRRFTDWFQVPMDDDEVQGLHRQLGKYHELAMVFTWVAGFLNVLAIWDAVEGPAYGFGDESDDSTDSTSSDPPAT
ncbi:DUF6677 family protein [Thalassoglobus sp. JC818]|uniref:DUF6677 family protein n=1 Tax=Thalassoglobus sp. JC818 TaxID=3232136 RepID=UPI0034583FB0